MPKVLRRASTALLVPIQEIQVLHRMKLVLNVFVERMDKNQVHTNQYSVNIVMLEHTVQSLVPLVLRRASTVSLVPIQEIQALYQMKLVLNV